MAGLDHEERFLFREEILALASALGDPATLDNVEDLLVDLITSSHFNAEVVTLERSLQAMLGQRQGTTLVNALTAAPETFDAVHDLRLQAEILERLTSWRARFGLAIDNAPGHPRRSWRLVGTPALEVENHAPEGPDGDGQLSSLCIRIYPSKGATVNIARHGLKLRHINTCQQLP